MSASPDPGTPSSSSAPAGLLRTHPHHHQHHHNLHLSTPPPQPPAAASPQLAMTPHQQALAPACAAPPPSPASASPASRDYRKGNWTLHETLVLITAKRLDDDRRAGGGGIGISAPSSSSSPATTPRSAEQRWKWVENYCWAHGCLRSQNQCNDKWDNLLRDYKKVRDFHSRLASNSSAVPSGSGAAAAPLPAPTSSYWAMERHERKERNLPTNLAPEVHDALCDVLSRRAARRGGAAVAPSPAPPLALPAPPLPPTSPPKPLLSQQQQQHRPTAPHPPLLQLPPPPPVSVAPAPATTSVSEDEMTTGSSSDSGSSSGRGEPEAKRQRRRQGRGRPSEDGRLGSSVVRGATVLARTLAACEEKRERRHRELLELEERRLRLDAERADARRQGFAGLISAVHSLSAAIHALVSDHAHGRSGDSSR